jgi:hypothetical protein
MSALEHELIERISRLDEEKQRKVLEYVQTIENDARINSIQLSS